MRRIDFNREMVAAYRREELASSPSKIVKRNRWRVNHVAKPELIEYQHRANVIRSAGAMKRIEFAIDCVMGGGE